MFAFFVIRILSNAIIWFLLYRPHLGAFVNHNAYQKIKNKITNRLKYAGDIKGYVFF